MPVSATPHIAPLSDRQLKIRDHGLLASVAFLVVIPLAVIVPRFFRTFTTRWWPVHWLLNSVVSGSLIIASWVKVGHRQHETVDPHMRIGFIIFGLFLGQMVLGTVIHYVRAIFPFKGHRPPQNYLHAVLGLTIIALSQYQVHDGIFNKWPRVTRNLHPAGNAIKTTWWVLTIGFWILYTIGLSLLRRQHKQEAERKLSQLYKQQSSVEMF